MKIVIRLDDHSLNEVLKMITYFIDQESQHFITTSYSESAVRAYKDPVFRSILDNSDLNLCDGRGMMLLAKLSGAKLTKGVAGVDLVRGIAERFAGIFLCGSEAEVVRAAAEGFGNNVCGYVDGYSGDEVMYKRIVEAQPRILLVALGMPKQEKWISENLKRFPSVKVAIGVGGSFDCIVGKVVRAPQLMSRLCLEWLWRLMLEPRRFSRILQGVVVFPFLTICGWIRFESRVLAIERAD